MTTDYKTIAEIARDVGFPFDAELGSGQQIHAVAITPNQLTVLCWMLDTGAYILCSPVAEGKLLTPKVVRWELVYDDNDSGKTEVEWFRTESEVDSFLHSFPETIKLRVTRHEFEVE